jgi:hypothetical protein
MKMRLGLTAVAAAAAALLLNPIAGQAADHRDAPTIDDYSAIDINDVFMFRDPPCTTANCTSSNLVMVLSTQAVADPHFGVSYHFQSNALYRLHFSTTPDAITKGIPTATIDIVFSPFDNNSACPAPAPLCQTFRAFFPNGAVVEGLTTQGSNGGTPNTPVVTQDKSKTISVFAGPREDPFFFDLIGFNRFIADFNKQPTTPTPHFNLFTGVDAFLGKNINAIVLEFPIKLLLPKAGSTKLAAWAVTYLGDLDNDEDNRGDLRHDEDNRGDLRHDDAGKHLGALRQVDRMGNPGVNTTLINAPLKDAFNFGLPQNDARDFAPTIAGNLIRYGVNQQIVLPVLATAAIPDTLKFDTTLPDGYLQVPPNGRQLSDRTTDFLLTLFFNVQGPPGTQHPGNVTCPQIAETAFSDCTKPKVYLTEFPFVGPPLQQTP